MASDTSTTTITDEERRWVVIGVCLIKVLNPALRNVIATEMTKWHQLLCQPPAEIDRQEYARHLKHFEPSTIELNYRNINNNGHTIPQLCDYAVKDPVSLAKLFVQPQMCKFTGFDETMDLSAVLSVICQAAPFTAASAHAKKVRSDIRNEWAHCNFANWTEAKFNDAFFWMETLLKNVNLPPEEEQQICDDLNSWKDKESLSSLDQAVVIRTLTSLRKAFDEICYAVKDWNIEWDEINALKSKLQFESEKRDEMRRELTENTNFSKCNANRLDDLEKKIELSGITEKNTALPYVFTAPTRNPFFTGRSEETNKLKRILKHEETLIEKKVRVALVWGLGGIGKTTLVAEYAHEMKHFYKAGVYWFSAENDAFLNMSVSGIAWKIAHASHNSFNSNLSMILAKISTTNDPCLIVLDCLDQLELSSNMMEFLSFPSNTNICGHFIVITRRNQKRLFNEVSVFDEDSCLQLESFQSHEAEEFLYLRSGITNDENIDRPHIEFLCEKLGKLPLALEQVGAYIAMLECSFYSYRKQYEDERLRLLEQQKGRAVAPGKESESRLAVHTTWRINMEYIKKSSNGLEAVRFLNACAFFNRNEIEEELINVGKPEVEGVSYRKCVSSPLGSRQILKLLTDFSLFKYVDKKSKSIRTHRLVQELIKESLDPESKAKSFTDAVRMLSYALAKCSSPSDFILVNEKNDEEQNIAISKLHQHFSHFYMWSKFCIHGHQLCRSMEDMLGTLDNGCLQLMWFSETAQIFYECAVHLSANHEHEEAKRILNFGYRVLDWLHSEKCSALKSFVSNRLFFPLRIPLPKSFQTEINRLCTPPHVALSALTEQFDLADGGPDVVKSEKDGNKPFKEVHAEEVYDAYSSTVNLVPNWENFSLKDANDYIARHPDCWKGYAGRALALKRSKDKNSAEYSAEYAAALAYSHNRNIFSDSLQFKESFLDLQHRIRVCDSVDELKNAIYSDGLQDGELKFLLLGSAEYILDVETFAKPWNNCVLIGTRKNDSVVLKVNGSIQLLMCMLENLSFHFDQGQLSCLPDSFVKLLTCNFTSHSVESMDAVTTHSEFNAEQCNFRDSEGGGLSCFGPGNVVVTHCSFRNNRLGGLILAADKNGNAPKCDVSNCNIHYNGIDGIRICENKKFTLIRNSNVYCNAHSGIYIQDAAAEIRENKIFDNDSWGVFTKGNSDCHITMNSIFRNKNGGIRLGFEQEKEKIVETVVEKNEIYDNDGPGFVDDQMNHKKSKTMHENDDLGRSYSKSSDSSQSAKYNDNRICRNVESVKDAKVNFSVPYCSNCHKKSTLRSCDRCFTTAYCNETCQEDHLSKHKIICEYLREKSSCLITSMETAHNHDMLGFEGREEIDRSRCGQPPRDGTRFIVKVFNIYTHEEKESTLVLYDRSLQLRVKFNSFVITELVREYGVMCDRKSSEKELFLYCMFDGNNQLRLITSEFAEFQNW